MYPSRVYESIQTYTMHDPPVYPRSMPFPKDTNAVPINNANADRPFKNTLLLKSTHLLQRPRQPLILPQQFKHLAHLQVSRILHFHEFLDRRIDLGHISRREDRGEVGESLR